MKRKPQPLWNPYVAGVALGLVLSLSFLLSGHGLGASGAFARVAVWVEDLVAPGHVDRTPELARYAGGPLNPLSHWLVWGVLGTAIGGLVSGLLAGRAGVETIRGPQVSVRQRWLLALVGGALVGYGARLARGCTSGQALSGGAVLSLGSWAFMFAVFGGGYLLAYPVRRLWLEGGDRAPAGS
ncbi:MAG: YeeE/YedE thiosulfate transporter family protein [Planctomycetota bacterium]